MILLFAGLASAGSLTDLLVAELDRAMVTLGDRDDAPYHVAIQVEDRLETLITARDGALVSERSDRARWLDVDLRVGDPDLDNTHPLRGFSALEGDGRSDVQLPLDDGYALRHALWLELDRGYRDAVERIVVLRSNQNVLVEEEDRAPDFSLREPVTDAVEVPAVSIDASAWRALLVDTSALLASAEVVHQGALSLNAVRSVKTYVDSAGSKLVHGRTQARLSISLSTTADDGDVVTVYEAIDVHDPTTLPREDLADRTAAAVERLAALSAAPRGEPYSGPVILTGEATGVFFHEVFGHRVEGHRQKREDEGKTFADHVGRSILPEWVSVYDDPRIPALHGVDLNGHYLWDDEGVPAMRAELVQDGNFVGFLMGRSPLAEFPDSNGHGRRSSGNWPSSRMGNTIVEPSRTVPVAELRRRLIAELRSQKLEYGYLVEEIEGGFTLTGRITPNAFNVRATSSRRIYADGRPDELVRGIDLVGTPFVAFSNLIAAGDDPAVFNGTCGAESGWVPVSAVAPSMLFRRLEFQLKEKGQERPPLLDKPGVSGDGAAMLPGGER
ncbi:MAG: TldD protein [Myxococcota bacterium]